MNSCYGADAFGRAARDPKRPFARAQGCKSKKPHVEAFAEPHAGVKTARRQILGFEPREDMLDVALDGLRARGSLEGDPDRKPIRPKCERHLAADDPGG